MHFRFLLPGLTPINRKKIRVRRSTNMKLTYESLISWIWILPYQNRSYFLLYSSLHLTCFRPVQMLVLTSMFHQLSLLALRPNNIAAAAKTVVKRILLFMLEFIECKYSYKLYNGYILSQFDNNNKCCHPVNRR